MTGGPWTQSMKVVHGPGPKWGSMDPWSTFCPHPDVMAMVDIFFNDRGDRMKESNISYLKLNNNK